MIPKPTASTVFCVKLDANFIVKKAIAKVGHDTDEVKATDEDYEKLHGCCMYERK